MVGNNGIERRDFLAREVFNVTHWVWTGNVNNPDNETESILNILKCDSFKLLQTFSPVSYTHLTLPTKLEV